MITRIAGTLVEKHPPQVVVMTHGVGYELDVPMSTFYNLPRTGEPKLSSWRDGWRNLKHLLRLRMQRSPSGNGSS